MKKTNGVNEAGFLFSLVLNRLHFQLGNNPCSLIKAMESKYVLALDVGTTTVRCYVLDQSTAAIGIASEEVKYKI